MRYRICESCDALVPDGTGHYCPAITHDDGGDPFQRFVLVRDVDSSGVSGTGVVACGVQFPDGVVVLRWITQNAPCSTVIYENGIAGVERVHGHGGDTVIQWIDHPEGK